MGATKTQKKRKASALWLLGADKNPNKAVAKLWRGWRMQAEAADRRIEMRKGRTSRHDQ